MADAADRTLPATPRRREAARVQGMVPNAAAPAWIATVAVVILVLPAWAETTVPAAVELMRESLVAAIHSPGGAPAAAAFLPGSLPAAVFLPTAAVILVAGAAGVAVRLLLDGSAWRLSRAAPTLRRIDPLAGLARVLSPASGLAALGNAAALAALVAAAAVSARPLVALLADQPDPDGTAAALFAARRALVPLVATAGFLAACRWVLARLRFERRIRMTPQEYSDEVRSLQANPRIRLLRERPAARSPARPAGAADPQPPAAAGRSHSPAGTA